MDPVYPPDLEDAGSCRHPCPVPMTTTASLFMIPFMSIPYRRTLGADAH
jgi:hypothetical protein